MPFDVETLTLSQAIDKARGLSDVQSDPGEIYVYRFEERHFLEKLVQFTEVSDIPRFQGPPFHKIGMAVRKVIIGYGDKTLIEEIKTVMGSDVPALRQQECLSSISSPTHPFVARLPLRPHLQRPQETR
jgi:hypothetical protein